METNKLAEVVRAKGYIQRAYKKGTKGSWKGASLNAEEAALISQTAQQLGVDETTLLRAYMRIGMAAVAAGKVTA